MKRVFTIIIAATTMLAACSKQSAGFVDPDHKGQFGKLEINVVDDTTRASADDNKIYLSDMYSDWANPNWEQTLAVVLVSEDQSLELEDSKPYKSYRSIRYFNDTQDPLEAGEEFSYTVKVVSTADNNSMYDYIDAAGGSSVAWSEAIFSSAKLIPDAAEGERLPYFEGKTSGVTVEAGYTRDVNVKVAIANSAVCVEFTEAFQNYFPEAHLTIEAASGKKFNVDYTASAPYKKTYYWVNPRHFKISGTVKRQSSGSGLQGAEEPIEDVTVADSKVEAQHCYTYRFDMSGTGAAGGITITYDDQPIGELTVRNPEGGDSFEVNPEE